MITNKLEVCNKIFEMLLNEIKTELFPKRQLEVAHIRSADSNTQDLSVPEPEPIK
jgi:hypothetical protein